MTLKEKRAAAMKKAGEYNARIKAGETLSDDDLKAMKDLLASITDLDAQIKKADDAAKLVSQISALGEPDKPQPTGNEQGAGGDSDTSDQAKSLGEYFVKSTGPRLKEVKGLSNWTVSAPEYKAATDLIATGGSDGPLSALLTQVDKNVVQAYRRPTVTGLFGQGTLTAQALTYFVEAAREGDFGAVAEGGKKPQLTYPNPVSVTETLHKIAGWINVSDEMMEDLPFLVSEINGRLLYDLSIQEEYQVLNGDGTDPNVKGLLLRDGIQTAATAAKGSDAETLFHARTLIQNTTGLAADGVIINPSDYEALRLSKDANGQYFGGGFFAGQYGQGGVPVDPNLWGLTTVVSPAVAVGTAVVGAFKQGATVYRKGGVRVESTNSHGDNFTSNIVTIRAEERVAFAVRKPQAFVNVSLSTKPAATTPAK